MCKQGERVPFSSVLDFIEVNTDKRIANKNLNNAHLQNIVNMDDFATRQFFIGDNGISKL